MTEFVLLFEGTVPPGSPQEMQNRTLKWIQWIQELTHKGQVQSPGCPLEGVMKRVAGRTRQVTDVEYSELKDPVGGFMIILANDIDHAVEISCGCPGLDHEGKVEVRPVMTIN